MEDKTPPTSIPAPINAAEYLAQHEAEERQILKDSVRSILMDDGDIATFKIAVAKSIRRIEGKSKDFKTRKFNTQRVRIALELIDALAQEIREELLPPSK